MNAERLLERATDVVARRRGTYGQPLDLFERVAVRWSQVLGTKVTPAQAMLCLIDPSPTHQHSFDQKYMVAAAICVGSVKRPMGMLSSTA